MSNSHIPSVLALVLEIKNRGGTETDLYHLEMPLLGKVADLIVQEVHGIYRVTVDYKMPTEEMVAAGDYDWSNRSINSVNFPAPPKFRELGRVDVNVHLVPCKKLISYRRALSMLNSLGLRPGILPEQLAIGASFPQKQIEFPIFQIGSLWADRGGQRATYLRRGNKERGLSVAWIKYGFQPYYRIIGVEKDYFRK
ncbi:MAG: hypothetical protein HY506_01530 [Candidatus Yanofskybacteria bacterium]|nr:hypothetical protein [Candidatus Yanofskybacteria bacterium]